VLSSLASGFEGEVAWGRGMNWRGWLVMAFGMLLIVKVFLVNELSWWWVTFPLWIPFALAGALGALIGVALMVFLVASGINEFYG
jgi:hypothetical protein